MNSPPLGSPFELWFFNFVKSKESALTPSEFKILTLNLRWDGAGLDKLDVKFKFGIIFLVLVSTAENKLSLVVFLHRDSEDDQPKLDQDDESFEMRDRCCFFSYYF